MAARDLATAALRVIAATIATQTVAESASAQSGSSKTPPRTRWQASRRLNPWHSRRSAPLLSGVTG
jgi:hypothetical protein